MRRLLVVLLAIAVVAQLANGIFDTQEEVDKFNSEGHTWKAVLRDRSSLPPVIKDFNPEEEEKKWYGLHDGFSGSLD